MNDFLREIRYTLEDVLEAKKEYEKLLNMCHIKLEYLRITSIREPLDGVKQAIEKATMAEAIHIHKFINALDGLIDKFLENNDVGEV